MQNNYGYGQNNGYMPMQGQQMQMGQMQIGQMQMGQMQMQGQQMPPKIPKYRMVELLSQYVQMNTGMAVQCVEKIHEAPDTIRHSCVPMGITTLQRYVFTAQSGWDTLQIPFYFCPQCGKLFMYQDYE